MSVNERIKREQIAYDSSDLYEQSAKLQSRFRHVFESKNTIYAEKSFEENLANLCRDAVVLDYGCLNGSQVPLYHGLGARRLIGIDISENGIADAKASYGHIAEFHVCDAHNLTIINDESIDLIVGRGILHHLEYEQAIREIIRILKKGGSALFVEPLYDNPASIAFRRLTPKARTRDERPLSRQQIEWADKQFTWNSHKFCNLISTPIGMITSQLPVSPANPILDAADFLDRKLEKTVLKYWMRQVYLFWTK